MSSDWLAGVFTDAHVCVSAEPRVELFVAETSSPPDRTLLVIHGGPDWDHSYLRDPLGELAEQRRLLLPDLRGCGRSTWGLAGEQYMWDLIVTDLLALLDARDVQQSDVLGFSTGGLIAQRLALSAPERVRRLVIASSGVLPVPPDAFDGWQAREQRQAMAARLKPDAHAISGPELTRAWANADAATDLWRTEMLPTYLKRLEAVRFSGEWTRLWLAGALPSARPDDALRRLADSGIPLLLLHGRQDMTFPVALSEQTARAIPEARAVVLEEAGHMAHIDQPQQWLAALADFLE